MSIFQGAASPTARRRPPGLVKSQFSTDPWNGGYNGATLHHRGLATPVQAAAFAMGRPPKPTECGWCGSQDFVVAHTEDYDHPLAYLALCYPCHHALHLRYRDPEWWAMWQTMVLGGYRPPPCRYNWRQFRRDHWNHDPANWPGEVLDERPDTWLTRIDGTVPDQVPGWALVGGPEFVPQEGQPLIFTHLQDLIAQDTLPGM